MLLHRYVKYKKNVGQKKGTTKKVVPFCTSSGIRTLDPLIKSQLLYQLS